MTAFDDYLSLSGVDFEPVRCLSLTGVSGSGKTTYINHLLEVHPGFAQHPFDRYQGPLIWGEVRPDNALVVLDDLLCWRDLVGAVSLLSRGHRLIVASHLPRCWLALLTSPWPCAHFVLDKDPIKLMRYLERHAVDYDAFAVKDFVRRFGANYTDIDIILEHEHSKDFSTAYRRFLRHCRLQHG